MIQYSSIGNNNRQLEIPEYGRGKNPGSEKDALFLGVPEKPETPDTAPHLHNGHGFRPPPPVGNAKTDRKRGH